jgi:hypothetical protein
MFLQTNLVANILSYFCHPCQCQVECRWHLWMEQTWILVSSCSMSQLGNNAWTILSLMMQAPLATGHQQSYVIAMNVDQAGQTRQWTRDYREVEEQLCYCHWDPHCKNQCRKMWILMAHFKHGRELFSTSGTGNPGLKNNGAQLISAFGTEMVIYRITRGISTT